MSNFNLNVQAFKGGKGKRYDPSCGGQEGIIWNFVDAYIGDTRTHAIYSLRSDNRYFVFNINDDSFPGLPEDGFHYGWAASAVRCFENRVSTDSWNVEGGDGNCYGTSHMLDRMRADGKSLGEMRHYVDDEENNETKLYEKYK